MSWNVLNSSSSNSKKHPKINSRHLDNFNRLKALRQLMIKEQSNIDIFCFRDVCSDWYLGVSAILHEDFQYLYSPDRVNKGILIIINTSRLTTLEKQHLIVVDTIKSFPKDKIVDVHLKGYQEVYNSIFPHFGYGRYKNKKGVVPFWYSIKTKNISF